MNSTPPARTEGTQNTHHTPHTTHTPHTHQTTHHTTHTSTQHNTHITPHPTTDTPHHTHHTHITLHRHTHRGVNLGQPGAYATRVLHGMVRLGCSGRRLPYSSAQVSSDPHTQHTTPHTHRGVNLGQPGSYGTRILDGMVRLACPGDVSHTARLRSAQTHTHCTPHQTSHIGGGF